MQELIERDIELDPARAANLIETWEKLAKLKLHAVRMEVRVQTMMMNDER